MGREPHDWDLTTSALPEEMHRAFAGFRTVDTGLRHGTVTVLIDGRSLEVTTYRLDGDYSDHRHPDGVTFTRDLTEDLARRDFTMNAMAMTPEGKLLDPFGGREDIERRVIRCVGDPETRFREDALRILRALRFAAVLGFTIDPATAGAMSRCRELMKELSAERVCSELTKLLCASKAGEVLRDYPAELGVLLPELLPAVGCRQHHFRHVYDVWGHTCEVVRRIRPEPALRWTALLHDLGKPACRTVGEDGLDHFPGHAAESLRLAEAVTERLRFDGETRRRVLFLVEHHDGRIPPELKAARRALSRFGPDDLLDLIEFFEADNLGQSPAFHHEGEDYEKLADMVRTMLREKECFTLSRLAVKVDDLTALGIRGPTVGESLRFLLDAVIEEKCPNDRQMLLDYLKKRKTDAL
ncbi:MAG: HD domain-containing protein [Oscillospiraceae bacterium]|nr:HD domain-containing protein [Oscillospiraceae bacterium]